MIAMAIANDPDVIVADEPTSALDATVQAQVLDALESARRATGAALLLVSHDLGVIAGAADRVAVMYAGRIVETAPVDALFARPRMPYTLGLLGSVPRLDVAVPLTPIPGGPPAPGGAGPGCSFAPRCPLAADACRTDEPELAGSEGHLAACVRPDALAGRSAAELFPASAPLRRTPRAARRCYASRASPSPSRCRGVRASGCADGHRRSGLRLNGWIWRSAGARRWPWSVSRARARPAP